jgi:hypothetical protein
VSTVGGFSEVEASPPTVASVSVVGASDVDLKTNCSKPQSTVSFLVLLGFFCVLIFLFYLV